MRPSPAQENGRGGWTQETRGWGELGATAPPCVRVCNNDNVNTAPQGIQCERQPMEEAEADQPAGALPVVDPSYSACAADMVLDAPKPSRFAASCCSVEVMKGAAGWRCCSLVCTSDTCSVIKEKKRVG